MMLNSVHDCRLIDLPRHESERGSLTEVQNDNTLPFAIRRVFYIYDVPGDAERGAHAHKQDHELIMAASGSFDIEVYDGRERRSFTLRRPYQGLYVPPGLWLQMKNFSSGSIALVLVSAPYTEEDYIREIDGYYAYLQQQNQNEIPFS
ncbi:MAG: sugar 3,4-ketoisomerase [Muribaculaceae bacterium]